MEENSIAEEGVAYNMLRASPTGELNTKSSLL